MHIKCKYVVHKNGQYRWKPPTDAVAAGFKGVSLGTDASKALTAATKLNGLLVEWRAGRYNPASSPSPRTVSDLVQQYIASDRWPDHPNTQTQYRRLLSTFLEITVDGTEIAAKRPDTITPLVAGRLYRGWRDRSGLRMANYRVSVLRSCWNTCKALELVETNPWETLRLKTPPKRTNTWTEDQLTAFVAAAEADGHLGMALLAELGWDLGMRPSDLRELKWSQWDGKGFRFKAQKTAGRGGTEQYLQVDHSLAERLNALRMGQQSGFVCVSPTSELYTESNFSYLFRKFREKCGLPNDLQFRDLRRTVATEIIEAGASVSSAAHALGHSSTKMVDSHYDAKRKSTDLANEALKLRRTTHRKKD